MSKWKNEVVIFLFLNNFLKKLLRKSGKFSDFKQVKKSRNFADFKQLRERSNFADFKVLVF